MLDRETKRSLERYTRQYARAIGWPTLVKGREGIIERLLARIRQSGAMIPPVYLSNIVGEFDIDPIPEIVSDSRDAHASLRYDEQAGCFRIRIWRGDLLDQPGLFDVEERLTYRGRFSYAHEIAHRFFYVFCRNGLRWRRAIDVVTDQLDSRSATIVRQRLSHIEEQTCNTIARRVLAPVPDVAAFVRCMLDPDQPDSDHFVQHFGTIVTAVSENFGISMQPALYQLQAAMVDGFLILPRGFVAMYVGAHVTATAEIRSLSLEAVIGNSELIRLRADRWYLWKADPGVFGAAFRKQCLRLLSGIDSVSISRQRLGLNVALRREGLGSRILDGWWSPVNWNSDPLEQRGRGGFRTALFWGRLTDG